MIRKDVKFGLTIGGILVIVLVVYLSVITRGPDKPKSQDVTLAQNATDGQQPQAAPDANAPSPAATPGTASQPPLSAPPGGASALPIVPAATDTTTASTPPPTSPAPAVRPADAAPTRADSSGEVATTVTPSITTPVAGAADGSPANSTSAGNNAAPDAPAPVASARRASWESALNNGPTALFAPADPDRTPSASAAADPAPVNGADPQPAAAQQYPSPDNPPTPGRRTSGGGGGSSDSTAAPAPSHAKPSAPAAVADGLPTTRPTVATQHKVAAGETFVSLARTVYGDRKFYLQILAANPGIDPKHLKPGMTITLPAYDGSASTPAAAAPAAAAGSSAAPKNDAAAPKDAAADKAPAKKAVDTAHEYEVEAGDTLERISRKLYHNQKWHRIYELNKEEIGDDPADLKVGMVLKLPEAPLAEASR